MAASAFGTVEREALGALVRADRGAVAEALAASRFDAERFVRFVRHHQVAGYVHTALEAMGLETALPAEEARRLSASFVRQWATNERIARELGRVRAAFDDAGCPFVLLKGLHLACAYYGNVDRRGISDIDLLVRRRDIARAEAVLGSLGHARSSFALFGRRIAARFVHAFEFAGEEVPIDLHWELVNHPSYDLDDEALWATKRSCTIGGVTVNVLDDAHALLLALLGIAKDLELGTLRLKAFVDLHAIARVLDARAAWPAFFEARSQDRTAHTATALLCLLRAVFATEDSLPALEHHLRRAPRPALPPGLVARLTRGKRSAADRLWAAGLQDASPALVWGWWALSLPFRRSAHRSGHGGKRVGA